MLAAALLLTIPASAAYAQTSDTILTPGESFLWSVLGDGQDSIIVALSAISDALFATSEGIETLTNLMFDVDEKIDAISAENGALADAAVTNAVAINTLADQISVLTEEIEGLREAVEAIEQLDAARPETNTADNVAAATDSITINFLVDGSAVLKTWDAATVQCDNPIRLTGLHIDVAPGDDDIPNVVGLNVTGGGGAGILNNLYTDSNIEDNVITIDNIQQVAGTTQLTISGYSTDPVMVRISYEPASVCTASN